MIRVNNLQDNKNMDKIAQLGCYEVFEYQKDLPCLQGNIIHTNTEILKIKNCF